MSAMPESAHTQKRICFPCMPRRGRLPRYASAEHDSGNNQPHHPFAGLAPCAALVDLPDDDQQDDGQEDTQTKGHTVVYSRLATDP